MPVTLPDLPYPTDALEPHMSERTLQFHHGKHHKGYVDKTNAAIEGTDLAGADLEEIIRAAVRDKNKVGLFNNAAQVWNHNFFWHCISPDGGGAPDRDVSKALDEAFGNVDDFKAAFANAATGRFGSGWAWLVAHDGKLAVTSTPNADTPLVEGGTPLLTCDVWEHAYYLDYQNERARFVDVFLNNLVNWDHVSQQLKEAERTGNHKAA